MEKKLEIKLNKSIAYYAEAKYAIAVSGGSDSLALLYIMSQLNTKNFVVVHFDHDLRPESSQEAEFVEKESEKLGFKFVKKLWDKKDIESGNLYEKAREARYTFFKEVVDEFKLDGVLVAHSKTDLAETLLMRLGKGCSLKGASIFPKVTNVYGVNVERPLLEFSRKDLQDYLKSINLNWMIDPSNKDEHKIRPRIRKLLPTLDESGVTLNGILKSCEYFNQANSALDFYSEKEFTKLISCDELNYFAINKEEFFENPLDIQIRIILRIIKHFNSLLQSDFRHSPRRKKLIELLSRLQKNNDCIEEIDILNIEIHSGILFFYQKEHKKIKNVVYLDEITKNLRYNIVKKHNLQNLPKKLRNRIRENVKFKVLNQSLNISNFS